MRLDDPSAGGAGDRSAGRVLLVNTPRLAGEHYVILPPIGLGYLATSLRAHGYQVDVLDPIRDGTRLEHFEAFLGQHARRYDAFGFEYYSSMRSGVRAFAQAVKRAHPSALTMAGGPHPSAEPVDTLLETPDLDVTVTTDAEEVVPAILDRVGRGERLDDVPGIAWRDGDGIRHQPAGAFPDIDRYAAPAWDLMPPESYPLVPNGVFSKRDRIAPIIATRGCPFPCRFCEAPIKSGRTLRKRHPDTVVAEIERLARDHGVHEVHFMDDALTLHKPYARSLFEAIVASGARVDWAVPNGVRLDCLDEETLVLMERSGCYSFAVGIESGSQRVLDLMDKRLDLREVREKVALVKRATSIRVTGFFVIGYPGEQPDDIEATIRLARELDIDRANFFPFVPFPGGPLYQELKARGEVRPEHYDEHVIYSITYVAAGLAHEQVKGALRRANLLFHLRPRILWGMLRELRTLSQVKILLKRVLAILG